MKPVMLKDMDALNNAMTSLALLQAQYDKQEAALNAKIERLREDFNRATSEQCLRMDALRTQIQDFCALNKNLFETTRSKDFTSGTVGFRNNPPKVAFLNRKYNTKTVLELIRRLFSNYIRTKEEIDKETILVDYSQKRIDDAQLAAMGLKVDQDETFYIDLKLED